MDLRTAFRLAAAVAALASAMACAGRARATDGVVEINQASVKAAGGFPFTISQSGSYRLTGNLDLTDASARPGGQPPEMTTAIVVNASDVTIDLNGFTIKGATSCSGAPSTTCSPTGGGNGISASNGQHNVTVQNGTVRGMGNVGIILEGVESRVERVRSVSNGEFGIRAETVVNCTADDNGDAGISTAQAVLDTTASWNGQDGIIAASTVVNCTARSNGGNGIEGDTVANSTVENNVGIGMVARTATGCTASGNGSIQLSATGIAGHNICGSPGSPCP
jgi:hypothetical protein